VLSGLEGLLETVGLELISKITVCFVSLFVSETNQSSVIKPKYIITQTLRHGSLQACFFVSGEVPNASRM